ncbi:hypothetical protein D3C73_1148080 [compost metagenome]
MNIGMLQVDKQVHIMVEVICAVLRIRWNGPHNVHWEQSFQCLIAKAACFHVPGKLLVYTV